MITFDSVIKQIGSRTIFDGLTFTINPGDFVLITGRSGSGKTTLGRLLLGDVTPTSGDITIDGQSILKLPSHQLSLIRRKIGFIFQSYRIIPDKTIAENITYSLEIAGYKSADIATKIPELLDLVALTGKGDLFINQLSGGEVQRAAIARAIASDPPYLFADEPTGNLDDTTTKDIYALLQKINQSGTTIILATHDVTLITLHTSRHFHLEDGHLTESGQTITVTDPEITPVVPKLKKFKKKKS